MEENMFFFYLGTPNTAVLMRNLPIDLCYVGSFTNKHDQSLIFKKEQRRPPLLRGSLHLLTYCNIFMSPSKKCS